jgi:hypothetical protein
MTPSPNLSLKGERNDKKEKYAAAGQGTGGGNGRKGKSSPIVGEESGRDEGFLEFFWICFGQQ